MLFIVHKMDTDQVNAVFWIAARNMLEKSVRDKGAEISCLLSNQWYGMIVR